MPVTQTEVDGVPTLIAPTSAPMTAGLVFRVGRADETLARAGLTHLVQHLALDSGADGHLLGSVGAVTTSFHLQGDDRAVVAFLDAVCRSLRDLPVDRLAATKALLDRAAAGRTWPVTDELPRWRYGARDYGLVGYPELGVAGLAADDLRDWARTWFTRHNAVLWIAGDRVPAGLRLPLPDGERRSLPVPSSALPTTPAYVRSGTGRVAFDAVIRRRVAGSVFATVLAREIGRQLAPDGGPADEVDASYDTRGDDFATVTAVLSAPPDGPGRALDAVAEVFAKLRAGQVESADIYAIRHKSEAAMRHPDVEAARLPGCASNLLTGYPNRTIEELRAELRAVTAQDVHAVAAEALGSALLVVPEGHRADKVGFAAVPAYSTNVVRGTRFPSRDRDGLSVIIGLDGASLVTPGGPVTVRFDGCAAQLTWPDGGRELIGYDGAVLRLEPTLFEIPPTALARFDTAVDRAVTVPMPPRDPADIPRPLDRSASSTPTEAPKRFDTAILMLLRFGVIAMVCLSLLCTLGVANNAAADAASWVTVVLAWVFAAGLAVPLILFRRRYYRR